MFFARRERNGGGSRHEALVVVGVVAAAAVHTGAAHLAQRGRHRDRTFRRGVADVDPARHHTTFVPQARNITDSVLERAEVAISVSWDGKSDQLRLDGSPISGVDPVAEVTNVPCRLGE